ncbi:MAG: hypothetical protein FWH27_16925 [Planctomycetaceae bacterium]|nr:hypothetical protein [Planctomycetaceae bacterium]
MADKESPEIASDTAMIRFRCPQCTRPWKVASRHAGKKFRCPACFMERTIPEKTVEEPTGELYGVNETVRDTQDIIREQSLVSFRCRICRASMAVPTDQVGRTIACPDCDTPNVVPEPKAKDENKEPAATIEIYGVAGFGNASDLPPGDDVFSLYCPICNALLYARDDQIGSTIPCPDCERDVPVRGRPEKAVKEKHVAKVYEGSSTYELLTENQLPPDTQLVPVICSLCYTRMYAAIDQIGQEKDCPDCGKMNLVKPVAREAIRTVGELFVSSGGYGVGEVTERPKMRVNVDYRTVEGAVVEREPQPTDGSDYPDPAEMAERIRENREKEEQRKKKKRKQQDDEDEPTTAEKLEARAKKRSQGIGVVTFHRPKLPKRPLTKGYWKLFGSMSTYVHTVLAMLFFFLAAPVMVQLIDQYAPDVEQLAGGSPGTVTIYMFMGLYVYTLVFAGLCYLSQICLAVAMSTGNGADEVDEWGGFSPFLALSSLICVGGAVAVGWAPAILWKAYLGVIKAPAGVPGVLMLICAVASVFVFPVVLMRFLEGFDKHVIKSNAVWSLRLIPGTWLRFYLLSILWLIVPSLLLWRLFYSPDTSVKTICSLGIAFFLPLCAVCYFRLFGRLAWAVEVAVGKKLEELEALAAEEEDDDDWDDRPERSYDSRIDLPDHALRD